MKKAVVIGVAFLALFAFTSVIVRAGLADVAPATVEAGSIAPRLPDARERI